MLSIKSIYQIVKNVQRLSKIAVAISLGLLLMTIIDKYFLKGFINFYVHTPVTFILIFFLNLYVVRQEWTVLIKLYKYVKTSFTKKDLIKAAILLIPLLLVILLKNKLNEYVIHQNIFGLEYENLRLIMDLKFLAKSLVLYAGTIGVSIFANFLILKEPNSRLATSTKKFLPLAILLVLIFIAVKLYFVFAYQGNYQDDWYNIVAGQKFFENGTFTKVNQYFNGSGYRRGAYMTVLTNFFMLLFGRSVDIAQLAPAFVGLINFVLLLIIAKRVLKSNLSIIIFSLLYTVSPLVIFNHLFIRMYVFYELFFILIILLCIYFFRNLVHKKLIRTTLTVITLILLNIFIWKFTQDKSTIIFPIYSFAGILLVFYKANTFKYVIEKVFHSLSTRKALIFTLLLVLVPLVIVLINTFPLDLFKEIINSNTNEGASRSSLIRLLAYTYSPLILFVFLNFTRVLKQTISKQILIILGLGALVLHLLLPDTYQVIRGFNYAWGILFLVAMMFIEDLMGYVTYFTKNRFLYFATYMVFAISLLVPILRSYSNSFLTTGPSITGEVAYYEFDPTFKYIQEKLNDKTLVESSYNLVPDMNYGLPAKYVLDLDGSLKSNYFPPEVKKINTIDQLDNLDTNEDVCVILRDFSYKYLVKEDFMTYLVNHYYLDKSTIGYRIWCERKPI